MVVVARSDAVPSQWGGREMGRGKAITREDVLRFSEDRTDLPTPGGPSRAARLCAPPGAEHPTPGAPERSPGRWDDTIVGGSRKLQELLALARRVACSDASALILGESGTGKELIARAIHAWGAQAARPFVVVNCAAIPEALFESELFGHERGAFTHAVSRRIGLLEESHTGTLFLDEVGEMALTMQPKLLRFLQDQTITRVGHNKAIHLDVRIVAARIARWMSCDQRAGSGKICTGAWR